jgi:hypothetical protein
MKNHKLKKKRYNALGDVKAEIQSLGVEQIKEFSGDTLTTDQNKYTMVDSTVYVNGVPHGVD